MKGWPDVQTFDDVMAIKPNFLALIGYQYCLRYGAPCVGTFWRVRSSAIVKGLNISDTRHHTIMNTFKPKIGEPSKREQKD